MVTSIIRLDISPLYGTDARVNSSPAQTSASTPIADAQAPSAPLLVAKIIAPKCRTIRTQPVIQCADSGVNLPRATEANAHASSPTAITSGSLLQSTSKHLWEFLPRRMSLFNE